MLLVVAGHHVSGLGEATQISWMGSKEKDTLECPKTLVEAIFFLKVYSQMNGWDTNNVTMEVPLSHQEVVT